MAFTPDSPFPKSSGDNIRSKDWNDAIKEVQRLDTVKMDKAGGRFTGPLSIDGLVGIATTSPKQSLDVNGNIRMSGVRTKLFYRGDVDTHTGSLGFYSPDGGVTAIITPYDGNGNLLTNSTLRMGGFGSFESNNVNLNVSGRVSIGTTNTNNALTIEGAAGTYLNLRSKAAGGPFEILLGADSGGGIISTMTNHDLQLRAGTNDTKMIIRADGNVGIGTLTPGEKLEINGGSLYVRGESTGVIVDEGGKKRIGLMKYAGKEAGIWRLTNSNFEIGRVNPQVTALPGSPAAFTTDLFVASSGSVGIGTTNPNRALTIEGAVGTYLNVRSNAAGGPFEILLGADAAGGIISTMTNHDMQLRAGTNDIKMIIKANGNVGIGTTGPTSRLEIVGNDLQPGTVHLIPHTNKGPNHSHIHWDPTGDWYIRSANSTGKIIIQDTGGGVSIGTSALAPGYTLDVRATGIKLGLEGNGGGQLRLANNANDNKIFIEAFNTAGTGHAAELLLTGAFSQPVPRITLSANVIGLSSTVTAISGDLTIGGRITSGKGGFVMDQFINRLGEAVEEGDVVVIGSNQSSLSYGDHDNIPIPEIDLARQAYDTAVCGIVSHVYGELKPHPDESESDSKPKGRKKKATLTPQQFTPEEREKLERTQVQPDQIGWMVTLGAYAHCKVDADIAPIKIGDLLTTSPTKGHAQKVIDPSEAIGSIIGKALGSLKKGKGKIPVMVFLH